MTRSCRHFKPFPACCMACHLDREHRAELARRIGSWLCGLGAAAALGALLAYIVLGLSR